MPDPAPGMGVTTPQQPLAVPALLLTRVAHAVTGRNSGLPKEQDRGGGEVFTVPNLGLTEKPGHRPVLPAGALVSEEHAVGKIRAEKSLLDQLGGLAGGKPPQSPLVAKIADALPFRVRNPLLIRIQAPGYALRQWNLQIKFGIRQRFVKRPSPGKNLKGNHSVIGILKPDRSKGIPVDATTGNLESRKPLGGGRQRKGSLGAHLSFYHQLAPDPGIAVKLGRIEGKLQQAAGQGAVPKGLIVALPLVEFGPTRFFIPVPRRDILPPAPAFGHRTVPPLAPRVMVVDSLAEEARPSCLRVTHPPSNTLRLFDHSKLTDGGLRAVSHRVTSGWGAKHTVQAHPQGIEPNRSPCPQNPGQQKSHPNAEGAQATYRTGKDQRAGRKKDHPRKKGQLVDPAQCGSHQYEAEIGVADRDPDGRHLATCSAVDEHLTPRNQGKGIEWHIRLGAVVLRKKNRQKVNRHPGKDIEEKNLARPLQPGPPQGEHPESKGQVPGPDKAPLTEVPAQVGPGATLRQQGTDQTHHRVASHSSPEQQGGSLEKPGRTLGIGQAAVHD